MYLLKNWPFLSVSSVFVSGEICFCAAICGFHFGSIVPESEFRRMENRERKTFFSETLD
jgi:hypothetical protein